MADLALLRTFLAIHRTGSLTRAARQLRLTQPAISQQLKALEAQVGWPLFTRTARGVLPTPAAEELAAEIGAHVDALEVAVEKMRPGGQVGAGIVHLGARVDFLAACVLPALAEAWRGGLRVVCHPTTGTASRDGVRRGDLHVALTERPQADDELEYERLVDYDAVVIASPRRAAELRAMSPADRRSALATGPYVAYTGEAPRFRKVLESGFDVKVERDPVVVVPDLRACAEIVAAGSSVAVLERPLANAHLERGAVEELTPLRPAARTPLYLALRQGASVSPRVRTVADMLRAAAPSWGVVRSVARTR